MSRVPRYGSHLALFSLFSILLGHIPLDYLSSSLRRLSLRSMSLLPRRLLPLLRLAQTQRLAFLAGQRLRRPSPQALLADLVQPEAAQVALAPLLHDPVGRLLLARHAALRQLARAQGHRVEELHDVVGRRAQLRVEAGVAPVQVEEQVVSHRGGGHEAVLDAADQRQLEHGLDVGDVRDEDARRVDHEDALLDARGPVLRDHAHRRAQLARHPRLRPRARGFRPPHAHPPQRVQQRRLPRVRHPDYQRPQPRQRVRRRRALLDRRDQLADRAPVQLVREHDLRPPASSSPSSFSMYVCAAARRGARVQVAQQALLGVEPAVGGGRGAQVGLGIHDDAVAGGERGLEQRVGRGQRHAAVAALEHQADVGQGLAHRRQRARVVAQEVRPHDRRRRLEHGARHEAPA